MDCRRYAIVQKSLVFYGNPDFNIAILILDCRVTSFLASSRRGFRAKFVLVQYLMKHTVNSGMQLRKNR